MRWLLLLLLGVAIGALGAVTAVGAMRHTTPLPEALMAVTGHRFQKMKRSIETGRCERDLTLSHLRTLRQLGDDVEAAFLPTGRDDERFRRHLAAYLVAVDAALAEPPAQCAALQRALRDVGSRCKQFHDDYR